jgi:hypothetical protein
MRQSEITAAKCVVSAMLLGCFSVSPAAVSNANPGTAATSDLKPNELGKIPILEYHLIQPEPGYWARSAQEFKNDLELLYQAGYRSQGLSDYVRGKIDQPAGTHPVIFTFDDSSPGQFRYLIRNGKKEIDPDCAVGIFLAFRQRHPDFGMKATFFVLPAAAQPHKLFGQPEFESEKLRELAALGFEIGNHTLWHANLSKYGEGTVRKQLGLAVQTIQAAVPGYNVHTLSLPFGAYPKDIAWAVSGSYKDVSYRNDAILRVSGGSASSPFSLHRDLLRLPRFQVSGKELQRLINYFEKHPAEIFVSDGKADTVTFPAGLNEEFNSSVFKSLRVLNY